MRLSDKDRINIISAIRGIAGPKSCNIYLFGSRVSDQARGGDIDILILCETSGVNTLRKQKMTMLVEIEKRLGERRVDLTISSKDPSEQSEFVKSVISEAIELL